MSSTSAIPVTVLTGFLGSGKTTLLNRILTEQHGKKIAVIENEFGEVGVDNQLVIQSEEELFEMNNGCICCTVRGDLIRILGRLLKRKDKLDAILIETTGMANPAPVAQTFFTDDEMRTAFRLDAIVTVVDSKHILQHLDSEDEAQKQVAFADVILLNKTDLVMPSELDALEQRLRRMNAAAKIHRTQNCDLALSRVLEVGGFNLSRANELDPKFLELERPFEWSGLYPLPTGTHTLEIGFCDDPSHNHAPGETCDHHHGSETSIDLVLLNVPGTARPSPSASDLASDASHLTPLIEQADRLFNDWETSIQKGDTVRPEARLYRLPLPGPGEEHTYPLEVKTPGQVLVFEQHGEIPLHILVNGEYVKPIWQRDYHAAHTHNDAVTSVGISMPGDLDGKRLNAWIGELLKTKGGDSYRMKGVMSIKGSNKRLVFQGVHMLFDAKFDREWGQDKRQNTLVFIGKNLDRAALNEAFKNCLA